MSGIGSEPAHRCPRRNTLRGSQIHCLYCMLERRWRRTESRGCDEVSVWRECRWWWDEWCMTRGPMMIHLYMSWSNKLIAIIKQTWDRPEWGKRLMTAEVKPKSHPRQAPPWWWKKGRTYCIYFQPRIEKWRLKCIMYSNSMVLRPAKRRSVVMFLLVCTLIGERMRPRFLAKTVGWWGHLWWRDALWPRCCCNDLCLCEWGLQCLY